MSLLVPQSVEDAAHEVKVTAMQAQVTLAAIHELVTNLNEIVLAIKALIPVKP